jgi:hypothetical protein
MPDVTNELLPGHLKQIQVRLSRLGDGQRSIFEELRAHKQLIAGSLAGQATDEGRTASIEARPDPIEARLEPRDQ